MLRKIKQRKEIVSAIFYRMWKEGFSIKVTYDRGLMEVREHEGRRSISVRGSNKCKGAGVSEHGCSQSRKEARGSGTEGVRGREV